MLEENVIRLDEIACSTPFRFDRRTKPGTDSSEESCAREVAPRDTYEPSARNDRARQLADIRKKMKAGYYNSEEVLEDLSDTFAKAFDKAL